MDIKDRILVMRRKLGKKFVEQFGFELRDVTFTKIVNYLHLPKDSSSLAVARILFGLAMLFDIPDERGGERMELRWGDPHKCHFPLLPFVRGLPMPYMALVYAALWFGALGIMLGYKYRISASVFTTCYWYLFIIEKSYWNNHSYLFGLVAFLLTFTQANCYWSLDAHLDPSQRRETVPYWNYFVLKYQFFILYFMAGMKKGTSEWLTGYSMKTLSEHWVFEPFKLFLTVPQIDYLVVHWFIFVFDLTVSMWMMWGRTRHVAMFFCAMFHLMNSRLFRIGMFPWVCLATMPLYYPFDWPKTIIASLKRRCLKIRSKICGIILPIATKLVCYCIKCYYYGKDKVQKKHKEAKINDENIDSKKDKKNNDKQKNECENAAKVAENCNKRTLNHEEFYDTDLKKKDKLAEDVTNKLKNDSDDADKRKKITTFLIFFYVFIQAFLPYSHFITKGYNNWTNGLYGYSWDMMVHSWDTHSAVLRVVNHRGEELFMDPNILAPNDRWKRHGDMARQYAQCIKDNLIRLDQNKTDSINMSIYLDVWCSLNGRFVQRLFDPKVDLLSVPWSPFEELSFLMPVLDEAIYWRSDMDRIRDEVQSWGDNSDVVFIADFPGYDQERYIPFDLTNVTLTVLQGPVVFEPEVTTLSNGQSHQLTTGEKIDVDIGMFHKVINIGTQPAYYMYTFINATAEAKVKMEKPKLPVFRELSARLSKMLTFGKLVVRNVFGSAFAAGAAVSSNELGIDNRCEATSAAQQCDKKV